MMSLMNHSPAAEWIIRNSTDRSDPSCNVIFAATRFAASIAAETDLIPPPFCSPVGGSASNTGKSLLCFIAAAHAWLKAGEKYLRMSGVGVLSNIGRQPPLLSSAPQRLHRFDRNAVGGKCETGQHCQDRKRQSFPHRKPLT